MLISKDPRIKVYSELIAKYPDQNDTHTQMLKTMLDSAQAKSKESLTNISETTSFSVPGITKADEKCIKCAKVRAEHICEIVLCFECNGIGHERRQCPWKRCNLSIYDGNACKTCSSRGHTIAKCIDRGYLSKNSLSQLKCYICGKRGHLNCKDNLFLLN